MKIRISHITINHSPLAFYRNYCVTVDRGPYSPLKSTLKQQTGVLEMTPEFCVRKRVEIRVNINRVAGKVGEFHFGQRKVQEIVVCLWYDILHIR